MSVMSCLPFCSSWGSPSCTVHPSHLVQSDFHPTHCVHLPPCSTLIPALLTVWLLELLSAVLPFYLGFLLPTSHLNCRPLCNLQTDLSASQALSWTLALIFTCFHCCRAPLFYLYLACVCLLGTTTLCGRNWRRLLSFQYFMHIAVLSTCFLYSHQPQVWAIGV